MGSRPRRGPYSPHFAVPRELGFGSCIVAAGQRVFTGAQPLDGLWTSEAGLSWHAYAAQPVTDGAGISFTTGQNLTGDGVGKHPDQVWIGSVELEQVPTKSVVSDGKFWVDATASRVYLTATDAAKPAIEASQLNQFIRIRGSESSLDGAVIPTATRT